MMRPHSGFENFVPKGLLGGGKTPRPAKRAAEQPPGGGSGGGNKGRKFSARIVSKTIASRQHDAISCLNSPSHELVFVAKKHCKLKNNTVPLNHHHFFQMTETKTSLR